MLDEFTSMFINFHTYYMTLRQFIRWIYVKLHQGTYILDEFTSLYINLRPNTELGRKC